MYILLPSQFAFRPLNIALPLLSTTQADFGCIFMSSNSPIFRMCWSGLLSLNTCYRSETLIINACSLCFGTSHPFVNLLLTHTGYRRIELSLFHEFHDFLHSLTTEIEPSFFFGELYKRSRHIRWYINETYVRYLTSLSSAMMIQLRW